MHIEMVTGNTGYIAATQLIGLYRTDSSHCILLDSGTATDREEIEQTLLQAGMTPCGIIATHSHYDHFSNCTYFQQKYQIPVALSFGEAELCRTFPALKSHLFIYSAGEIMADPILRFMPCKVDRVIMPEEQDLYFRGVLFRVPRTPGHSPEHTSIITPDNVLFAGDAVLCGPALEHAKLPYAYNLRQYIESIEVLRNTGCGYLLIPHRGVVPAPFDDLLDANRDLYLDRIAAVTAIIDHPMSLEDITTALRDTLHIRVDTPRKAENLERFVRPYLECLLDDGVLKQSLRGSGTLCYGPADA